MNITTLIPAYKPKYITELLSSLRNQTRPSQRIVISDDSPNGEFRQELFSERVKPLLMGMNVEFVEGPRNGAFENFKHLLTLWNQSSELVHLMLDDDVVYPEFYERHLLAHGACDFSCSISQRWAANEGGVPLKGQPVPAAVRAHPNRLLALDSDVMFITTAAECTNWFGEFSNTVMRADTCDLLFQPEIAGVSYAGLWDLGYFLAASIRRPVGYIQDHLGHFRTGGTGNSSNLYGPFWKGAVLGYAALSLGGHRAGKLTHDQAIKCYGTIASVVNGRYAHEPDMVPFCSLLPKMAAGEVNADDLFIEAWTVFQKKNGF